MTDEAKVNITNASKRQITLPGTIVLAPGETKPAPVSVLENVVVKAWIDAKELMKGETEEGQKPAKDGDTSLKAVHSGGGSYAVKRGDEVVLKGMTKADAEAFNAMSDEDREALVKKD